MTRPGTLMLEPDQARERCLNLTRFRVPYAVEIDPRLPGMKDVIAVSTGAVLEGRPGWTHLRQRATNLSDASHFVQNCIKSELSFQCTPEVVDGREEWLFLIELRSSGRKE